MNNTGITIESHNNRVIPHIRINIHAQTSNPIRVEAPALETGPAVSRSYEPLETDGPATCLLYV